MITYQERKIRRALYYLDKIYNRAVYDATTQEQIRSIIGILERGVNNEQDHKEESKE